MRFAYPPYAGTFFICWGDETLNMSVWFRLRRVRVSEKFRKNRRLRKGYSVWILLLRASMFFPAQLHEWITLCKTSVLFYQ
uniref:Uncharacterized protein n=1 Tax=Candidatus Kentrum sp. LPFa TaxID=2126335 RepID=A0A450W1H0_9GAMM|nr:MAG: hypothetical protein BECKLPF1236A_GA0070988_1004514 [Candidatus Kentron sp. LPFa]VFK27318.1 MAG: hypothetical protein BECKLPF1236C_GA0070990_1004514 [Candidatus Kentron sp. LPFa]